MNRNTINSNNTSGFPNVGIVHKNTKYPRYRVSFKNKLKTNISRNFPYTPSGFLEACKYSQNTRDELFNLSLKSLQSNPLPCVSTDTDI